MELSERLRDRTVAQSLTRGIEAAAASIGREVRIMEVCGTHTVALRRSGVHSLLPRNVTMVSGPGCPVCVTPTGYIDNALALVESGQATVVSFGDMLKVPGSRGYSLSRHLESGRVRMLYSPTELTAIAEGSSGPVVFLGIGFETTIPAVASVFLKLGSEPQARLFLYAAFKTVMPALRALMAAPDLGIDAFLLPGHVSAIIGTRAYGELEAPGGAPGVVAGFEPVDMLYAILLILRQVASGSCRVQNAYPRAVRPEGNPRAWGLIERLLEPSDELWRGLGRIPGGGLRLRAQYAERDGERVFALPPIQDHESPGCLCGQVIRGKCLPADCALFGTSCTPDRPVGPCMVSSEGTCAAHLRYA
ncbi:MAG: hydrogenase formation protein HypD [Spirochaetales bacterium]|nr:hydrogenase formation protein HypD [Spirochaetales bacterium]